MRSSYFSTATGLAQYQPRTAALDGEHIRLTKGDYYSAYHTTDPAPGKFARRCKRIFFKYTTTDFARVNRETGEVNLRVKDAERRVGFHALRWAAAHPRHFSFEDVKPYDWQPPGR
jgi:hypothetical protein